MTKEYQAGLSLLIPSFLRDLNSAGEAGAAAKCLLSNENVVDNNCRKRCRKKLVPTFCLTAAGFDDIIDRACSIDISIDSNKLDKDNHRVTFDCFNATP
ncbi:unnamed protein product [Didymodactylos carnosus]|uniref:Uncharacterized protein n=1 Tax=Didymodactylos carnosus TaxID=1234261 RepID=A0A8S2LLG5_9BILA|nr:unnamed protein product [Didymodactylos carnosus]